MTPDTQAPPLLSPSFPNALASVRDPYNAADQDGRSRSLDGQGMQARWRSFRVRGVDA
jgi:hypothetical protein